MEEHLEIYSEVLSEVPIYKDSSWNSSIISVLNKNHYVLVFLNWKHIRHSKYYKIKNIVHEAIIYGYDHRKQTFNGLGFEIDGQTFGEFEITYKELERCLDLTIKDHLYKERWFAYYGFPVVSISINNPTRSPAINKTQLFFSLDRSKVFDKDICEEGSYANGHHVYLYLSYYFEELASHPQKLAPKEYILWNIIQYKLLQHKKFNLGTIQQLINESENKEIKRIQGLYKQSKRELTKLRSLSLKYQQTNYIEHLSHISNGFYKVYELEKRINAFFKDYLVRQKIDKFSRENWQ
ncbi:hypothetical protein [Bacillus sp. SM2101]|uniref:hypothetical protein n=1 Tax=Bacillus sp. SM2101 TaxID=2805366 RepID=UPI001BDF1973|nr:hypothetical protein [Bacillus sp. SM2101]